MCYHPLFSPPSDFFFCFATTPLRQSFCLSCFCLSFSLSEKAQCANVSTFLFICQSLEQRPAPSVYLHSAAPSAQPFLPLPFPLFQFFFHLLHLPIFSSPTQSFIARTQITPYFPIFFIQLCCVLFIWIPPLCHLNSIFCTILASPMSLPYPSAPTPPPPSPPALVHGSWHFHWSNIMTFPVLATTSASSFFGLNPPPSPPPLTRFGSIFRCECVSAHVWPIGLQNTLSLSPLSWNVSFCLLLLCYSFFFLHIFIFLPSYSIHHSICLSSPRWLMWLTPALQSRGVCVKVWLSIGSPISKACTMKGLEGCHYVFFSHPDRFLNLYYGLGWKTGFRRQYSSYTRHDSNIQKHLPSNSRSW